MLPNIYEVNAVGDGSLFVMPKPSGEHLHEAARHFLLLGIDIVVSHLECDEERQLGLAQEEAVFSEHGIRFICFPIRDHQLPVSNRYFTFIGQLYRMLCEGKNIAIHCRAGVGRTGVTASCLLINDGYTSKVAMGMVAAARGFPIPDTDAQYNFIVNYEKRLTQVICGKISKIPSQFRD